jgi:hypothetical protein
LAIRKLMTIGYEGANIRYRHEPVLGSPREIRHRLRATHDYAHFFREFARHLKKHQDLIGMLAAELTGNVAPASKHTETYG